MYKYILWVPIRPHGQEGKEVFFSPWSGGTYIDLLHSLFKGSKVEWHMIADLITLFYPHQKLLDKIAIYGIGFDRFPDQSCSCLNSATNHFVLRRQLPEQAAGNMFSLESELFREIPSFFLAMFAFIWYLHRSRSTRSRNPGSTLTWTSALPSPRSRPSPCTTCHGYLLYWIAYP